MSTGVHSLAFTNSLAIVCLVSEMIQGFVGPFGLLRRNAVPSIQFDTVQTSVCAKKEAFILELLCTHHVNEGCITEP